MDMQHYLVCTVRKNDDGLEQASLEGFVQSCDLKTAQQYYKDKLRQAAVRHSDRDNIRLFKLVAV
jgi:hypothetical protein